MPLSYSLFWILRCHSRSIILCLQFASAVCGIMIMRSKSRAEPHPDKAQIQGGARKDIMAEGFLRDHPGLRPFVLSDVQLTGTEIGGGAYGKVEEVMFPVGAAAKTIYDFLREAGAATEFVRECQLMSTLRRPSATRTSSSFLESPSFPALGYPPSSWSDC